MEQLRQQLSSAGIKVERLEVEVNPETYREAARQQAGSGSGSSSRHGDNGSGGSEYSGSEEDGEKHNSQRGRAVRQRQRPHKPVCLAKESSHDKRAIHRTHL